MLSDLTLAWHDALSESVYHDQSCEFCLTDLAGRTIRCAEGARIYNVEQAAWREMKAAQYLGVA